jgi:predicted nucleotidyltransferase
MATRRQILQVVQGIARLFKPQRVVLFGSHAYGTPTADSDVDLLVVTPYRGESHHLATRIRLAVNIPFPADILVRSPAEIRRRIRLNDFFILEISERGEVLYEAGNRGMGKKGRGGFHRHPPRNWPPKAAAKPAGPKSAAAPHAT